MSKRLQDYVKYTAAELENYVSTEGSCVHRINTDLHVSLAPYVLSDFQHSLKTHLFRRKVGYYDQSMDGIVLAIKNIKVFSGTSGAMRADEPKIHVNLNADCYTFRPVVGSILSGTVKHIGGNGSVGVVIYRVFNVNIRLKQKLHTGQVEINQELKFRIKTFNLQNVFPYIEGELLGDPGLRLKREGSDVNTVDSGIEEKDESDLQAEIKKELKDSPEQATTGDSSAARKTSKTRKRTKKDDDTDATPVKIKAEYPVQDLETAIAGDKHKAKKARKQRST